jgi:hypothetical protein
MSSKTVPWKDWEEWREVYELVTQDDATATQAAIVRIRDWQSRCRVPISVEATQYLLDSLLYDTQRLNRCYESRGSSDMLADGQCISRFVNLLTDLVQRGMYATSVESLANSIGIPSWIVQLRHTACHGAAFPRMGLLKRAARYLLYDFIIPRYWDAQAREINGDTDTVNTSWGPLRVMEWCKGLLDGEHAETSSSGISVDRDALYWIVVELRDCMSNDNTLDAYDHVVSILLSEFSSYETRMRLIRLGVLYRNRAIIKCALQDSQLRCIVQSMCLEEITDCHSSTNNLALLNLVASMVDISPPADVCENPKTDFTCSGRSFSYDSLVGI